MVSNLLGRVIGAISDGVFECLYGQPDISFINPDSQVVVRIAEVANWLGAEQVRIYRGLSLRGKPADVDDLPLSPEELGRVKRVDFYNNPREASSTPVIRLSSRPHIFYWLEED